MKLWRDFKLLALGVGLVLLDGCGPPEVEEDDNGLLTGRVVGKEHCNDVLHLVVAATQKPSWPADLKLVAGEYRSQSYQYLVRLRVEADLEANQSSGYNLGTCAAFSFKIIDIAQPQCFNDRLTAYPLWEVTALRPEAECIGLPNPR
jgi:hypothetical protein